MLEITPNHVTILHVETIEFLETACGCCERPLQYHPDTPKPEMCAGCASSIARARTAIQIDKAYRASQSRAYPHISSTLDEYIAAGIVLKAVR